MHAYPRISSLEHQRSHDSTIEIIRLPIIKLNPGKKIPWKKNPWENDPREKMSPNFRFPQFSVCGIGW